MKANWKFALLCAATIAFIGCKPQNQPVGPGGDDDPTDEFVSKISVKDKSLADWDNLPAEYVVSAECPDDASMLGLKSVKIYADYLYINLLVEYDPETMGDAPADVQFHVYLDTDNSDETGGYSDEFTDPNADILLEAALWDEDGGLCVYNPGVSKWWGEVGGTGWEWQDPSVEHDESDFWGCIVGQGQYPVGNSQLVDGKFEIQIMRALIPAGKEANAPWGDEFGIGFDIQQSWASVGILPLVSPTEGNENGYTAKLKVKIDQTK